MTEPRSVLLTATLDFVRAAHACPGVSRIALVGSLATLKPVPKDVDLLVTLTDRTDLAPLAQVARRLKGRANAINLAADVFLCDPDGLYLGRVCRYRDCHYRASCEGSHCGPGRHLNDDLHLVTLDKSMTRSPPFALWPVVERRVTAPPDVERLLLAELERAAPGSSAGPQGAE